jgi:hypothetical protein
MQTAIRNQVDEVLQEQTHQGDTFAKVRVGEETGWVQLEE